VEPERGASRGRRSRRGGRRAGRPAALELAGDPIGGLGRPVLALPWAIAQLAVFPSEEDEVGPDEFPFILDVEPKKRELYETRSETGEFMSGSSDTVNVRKGTATTESTEEADIETGGGLSLPVPIPGVGIFPVGGNVSGEWGTRDRKGTESVDMTTTDSSREKRETLSSTTTFSQLYQLMNAYHLGTNRCVLLVAPRPHTATSATEQVDFNLLEGARRLEGIQDFFVIVQAPSTLKGLCIQATLETGHTVNQRLGVLRMRKDDDFDIPDDIPDFLRPPEPIKRNLHPCSSRTDH
jgi:hypothetical protein